MRHTTRKLALVLGLLAAVWVIAGCSSDESSNVTGGSTTGDPDQQTVNLDDTYGGFLAVDEDPAFGDDELAAAISEEEAVADGYEGLDPNERARAQEMEENKRVWYSLTVLWGNLDTPNENEVSGGSQEEDPVVWDGTMTIGLGAIRVMRLISFEHPEDHLILPRPAAGTVQWSSVTHGYLDGLRVLLIYGGDEPAAQAPDDTLHFSAGPLGTVSLPIEELEDLNVIYDIPGSVEKVSFSAFRVEEAHHVRGFMAGRWGWAEGDSVGRFRGRWMSHTGAHLGFMRGHYGENSHGDQVFFGKYIDHQGAFRGFLRGTYEILRTVGNPDNPAGAPVNFEVGAFQGRWEDASGNQMGDLHGRWSRVGKRPGVFSGSWRGLGIAP